MNRSNTVQDQDEASQQNTTSKRLYDIHISTVTCKDFTFSSSCYHDTKKYNKHAELKFC